MPLEFYSTTPTLSGQGEIEIDLPNEPFELNSQPCNTLTIVNTIGSNLYASKDFFNTSMLILPNTAFTFTNITNANQIRLQKTSIGSQIVYYNWSN